MNIYRRYFRVTTGPLMDAIFRHKEIEKQANEKYKAILKEIGAKEEYYVRNGRLDAIIFESKPDERLYKRAGNGWYPKKNIAFSRDLHKRLSSVKTSDISDCLDVIGLSGTQTLVGGGRCYFPTITLIPWETGKVALVTVPWYDEDPEEIAKYLDYGTRFCSNLESLLWKPTAEMQEIKEWEAKKEIETWNEKVRLEKAGKAA